MPALPAWHGLFGRYQGCGATAKHVAALLGNIEERSLGGKGAEGPEETSRAKYIQELDSIPDKNPVLVDTFPHGVAVHHGGAHHAWCPEPYMICTPKGLTVGILMAST